jgi:hypothetical protein
MKDLTKTDIEGIERHWHNYKLLVWFLRIKGKYAFFKRMIFANKNITPYDLFKTMNNTHLGSIIIHYSDTSSIIDKKWGSIFTYVPFSFSWLDSNVDLKYMQCLSDEWVVFLREHNYDKNKKEI